MEEKGISHRDIKLNNILLGVDLEPKICDFGFARRNNDDYMQSMLGTPVTMAPEILMGNPYDKKCDLWSIGVIIYQMVFGCYPFPASTYN